MPPVILSVLPFALPFALSVNTKRIASSVHRVACLCACLCAAIATAQTQTPLIQVRIDPPQQAAPLVRIRWPATALTRAETARLLALDDARGAPLDFGFVIAPEDQGRTVRPMWLIVRLDGTAPYRLGASRDNAGGAGGAYRDDADALAGGRLPPLAELPVATVSAEAWGPIVALLEDAQAAQRSIDTRRRLRILAMAVAALVALAALIAFFARAQTRREDVTRL